MDKQERLELFLLKCDEYVVLHETSTQDSTKEHYFIFITKDDTKDSVVREVISSYEESYPLLDLSKETLKYMKDRQKSYHFIYIDTLDKKDPFFTLKEKSLKQNTNNIMSIRILGKPVDISQHLESNFNKYFEQFKEISISAGLVAKEEIQSGIKKGIELFQEKAPVVQENLNILGKKLGSKISELKKKLK